MILAGLSRVACLLHVASTGMDCLGPEDVFSRWLPPVGGERSGTGEGWMQLGHWDSQVPLSIQVVSGPPPLHWPSK